MPVDDLWYTRDRQPTARHGRGKRWRVRWVDDAGQQRSRLFAKRSAADQFDVQVRSDVLAGRYVAPSRVTFGEYATGWCESQVWRPTTRAQVESHLRRHVYPRLGGRPLVSVRPSDVQGLVKALSGSLAPATVQVVYRYVAAIFNAAVRDRLLAASPATGVRLPRKTPARVEPLPVELVHRLAERINPRFRGLVVVGAAAGLRQAEALGLEVDRLDLLRGTLRVDQQLVSLPHQRPWLAPPKTDASYRTIPIGKVLVQELSLHLAQFPAVEVEIEDHTGGQPVARKARLVFTTADGQPIRRQTFGRAWRSALAAALADMPADVAARFSGASFHDLRHLFASLLISHGSSVREVQERLGHATARETLDTYSHLMPSDADRSRQAVDLALAPQVAIRGVG